jgi:hypothetical protein
MLIKTREIQSSLTEKSSSKNSDAVLVLNDLGRRYGWSARVRK